MIQAIHRFEGTVNSATTDGIIALFGAPVTQEDHAVRACYAALEIRDALKRYAKLNRHSLGTPLACRVGLNSGTVVTRTIAGETHLECRAVGQTIQFAAHLAQLAPAGSLLLSAETLRLAEGHIQVTVPARSQNIEFAEPVYELSSARPSHSRFHVRAERGLTQFVGRFLEMQQLDRVREKAREGHGQLVAIIGEAGLGKSRIVHEFVGSFASEWTTFYTASLSYRRTSSYQPLIRMLRTYFEVGAGDDRSAIREKAMTRLLGLDPAADISPVLALLDVPVEDPSWQGLDSAQRHQRTLDAVKKILLCESDRQPLILVIEDLHWIDAQTQSFLEGLIDSLPCFRVLLLLTYRPEYEHHWDTRSYYTQIRIDLFSPETTRDFIGCLVGDDVSLASLRELLPKRGNPLFLEESIRALIEGNLLQGESGAYQLVRPIEELEIPPTVQAILAARIDRLPLADKRLLQTAAVIGADVPYILLRSVAELGEKELCSRLSNLCRAEFLYESRQLPDLWYSFKHAVTHEVSYTSLLGDERKTLHRKIVGALEEMYPDRSAEQAERLAHHAFRGEVWDKAASYLRQSGVKAFTRSANQEAVAFFEQALTALTHLPVTSETMQLAVDLRLALRNALWPLGQFETGFGHLGDAERFAQQIGDKRQLGWIAAYMSEHTRQTGHAADAPTFAARALTIADEIGDFQLCIAANYYLGTAYFVGGEYRRTDEYFGAILNLLRDERFRDRCGLAGFPAVMSRMFWPLALAERGELTLGLTEALEGVRLAGELEHPYSMICAMRAVGRIHSVQGDFDQAISVAEQSLALSREWKLPQLFPEVADLLGYLYALSGRVADGLALLNEALAALESMGMFQWRSSVLVHLGEAYLLAGRPRDATTIAKNAVALTRERGHRGYEAWALYLCGEAALHKEPPHFETAGASYGAAVAIASELGMRPLVAHCHLGLGKLYRRKACSQKARRHLSAGIRAYRELEMRFWLAMAEAELASTTAQQ